MKASVAAMPLDRMRFDASRSRDYEVNAHWALHVQTYLEGFRIPFVHAGLNEVVDYANYASELFRYSNVQRAQARDGAPAAQYWWIFPNLMLNFYPWGLSVNLVQPEGLDRTRVAFRSYVWDASKLDTGAGASLDRVEAEAEAIVQAVQRGVRSRCYKRARYSPPPHPRLPPSPPLARGERVVGHVAHRRHRQRLQARARPRADEDGHRPAGDDLARGHRRRSLVDVERAQHRSGRGHGAVAHRDHIGCEADAQARPAAEVGLAYAGLDRAQLLAVGAQDGEVFAGGRERQGRRGPRHGEAERGKREHPISRRLRGRIADDLVEHLEAHERRAHGVDAARPREPVLVALPRDAAP